MSLEKFEIFVGLILVILLTIWLAPSRNFPHGYNIKKIKLKYFGFLFNEGIGDFRKPKEISLQIFLFQLIGYIINILLLICVIILYCLNVDISTYIVLAVSLGEFVLCAFLPAIL